MNWELLDFDGAWESRLTVYTGLPGSGKSSRLIQEVNASRVSGRPTHTFACGESPHIASTQSITMYRKLTCREPGLSCDLDHLVTNDEAIARLREIPPGSLAAFEEAQYFDPKLVEEWVAAARRGVAVLGCTPSALQITRLREHRATITTLAVPCQRCRRNPATVYVALHHEGRTEVLCASCHEEVAREKRQDIVRLLRAADPRPGEDATYQPTGIPETAGWSVSREDSDTRLRLMVRCMEDEGLLVTNSQASLRYLDVGCNIGYFCQRIQEFGIMPRGVDVVGGLIDIARLIDAYVYVGHGDYVVADAYDYLEATTSEVFEVTSALSVVQWIMLQTNYDRGVACMKRLFERTRHLCFIEMGYADEPGYQGRLAPEIGPGWVEAQLRDAGGFDDVKRFDHAKHGLRRDLFVGIRRRA